ncbi:MAG: type II toxin-antitoxin system VapC family toxin [Rickettsiales bacterium]
MDLLLDTHVFLWWVQAPETLSNKALSVISSSENVIFVSSISLLEIAVKQSIGKLTSFIDFDKYISICNFLELPLTAKQAYAVKNLPLHHRDPFDRALIAQVKTTGLTLITRDKILAKYEIPIIEA